MGCVQSTDIDDEAKARNSQRLYSRFHVLVLLSSSALLAVRAIYIRPFILPMFISVLRAPLTIILFHSRQR
jgi:hypothetical protein